VIAIQLWADARTDASSSRHRDLIRDKVSAVDEPFGDGNVYIRKYQGRVMLMDTHQKCAAIRAVLDQLGSAPGHVDYRLLHESGRKPELTNGVYIIWGSAARPVYVGSTRRGMERLREHYRGQTTPAMAAAIKRNPDHPCWEVFFLSFDVSDTLLRAYEHGIERELSPLVSTLPWSRGARGEAR
jgi:hypothetical protein